jgi:hypothetical protein
MSETGKEVIAALFPFLGIIISVILSYLISNKINLLKIQSEFSGQLYKKRLKAYLEIFELVSGFTKIIKRKGFSYDELKDFYEKYSILDSKLGLLFSYSISSSSRLMEEINKNLSCLKPGDTIYKDSNKDITRKLGDVELSMKYELGIFVYTDPLKIIKKFKLPETYKEALAEMNKHR